MAAESLLGGQATDVIARDDVQKILDFSLGGAANAEIVTVEGGTVISGTNPNTALGVAEKQSVVIADSPVTVQVDNGVAQIEVALPANVALGVKAPETAVQPQQAELYLHSLLEQALPAASTDPAVQQARAAIEKAINTATRALEKQGVEQVVVNVVTVAAQNGASGDVTIKGQANSQEAMALVLPTPDGQPVPTKVVLENVETASVIGHGTVQVSQATLLTGDLANQQLIGSQGEDTLIGGGGNDTLVGGGGNDVFGFNSGGHYVIEQAQNGTFTFLFDGITSLDQLAQFVTNVEETSEGVTFTFSEGSTITLVGMTAADITADMIKFSL